MPTLNEIIEKRQSKKFVKKSYRPWNLNGNNDSFPKSPNQKPQENINQTDKQQITEELNNKKDSEVGEGDTQIEYQNGCQNRHQLDIKQVSNGDQLEYQTDIKQVSIRYQLDTEIDAEIDANSLKNRVAKLVGLQRKVLEFLVDLCIVKETNTVGNIETSLLTECLNTTYGNTKTVLNRLIIKGFLIRGNGKAAKGGYINLTVPISVKDIVLSLRKKRSLGIKTSDIINTVRNQLDINLGIKSLYSSSIINNTTTTKEGMIPKLISKALPKEWEEIIFDPIKEVGFSRTQILQLFEAGQCFAEGVQQSINYFAFDLEYNDLGKKYPDPLNVFMGTLRKGKLWSRPKNYESSQDRALRELLENKKAEAENRKKQITELFELHFTEWYGKQTDGFLRTLLPGIMQRNFSRESPMMFAQAKEHFKKQDMWLKICREFEDGGES